MLETDFKYILDTFFTLFTMTLIIFMVPGFAMLEAGLVRTKNVSAVLTTNVMIYAVASLAFLLVGYKLAFGNWDSVSSSIWAVFMFQMAFVGKTVNIMSGGVSERVRIIPLAIFTVVMGAVIYPLVVNISWGADVIAGTIFDIDIYDLAGSTVIHSTGGWALLLWIGWFGFNGGSIGSISSVENANSVAKTIMNTNTAGLAGAIIVGIIMYIKYKLFDITMILNGALGGLVAITAAPNLYDMYTPILIGFVGGALVVFAVAVFDKFKLDDPVGALSVHLVNGIWGTLAVGIFVDNVSFISQLKGVIVVGIFTFSLSFAVIYIINRLFKFRANDEAQLIGMDINECGVESYPEFKRAI